MEKIYLEQWLHEVIRQKIKEDPSFRAFMGKDHLECVTRDDIDRYQLFKLRQTVAYVTEKSAFYRELLGRKSITGEDIHTLSDLSLLPFTEPADIAEHPYNFTCVPLGEIERATTFISSGTIGPQKRVFFTEKDLEIMTDFMGVGMRTVAKQGDTVMIMLPGARVNGQSDLLAKGVRKMGGRPIKAEVTLTSEKLLQIIDRSRPTTLFTAVPLMWRITQETRGHGDLSSKGVQKIFITAAYPPQSMIEQIRDIWNCDVHVHYGLTEMGLGVAVDCQAHTGYHYDEADLLVEVVDPVTGEVLGNDQEGELVFTTLNRSAMPLLRYRTHDLSSLSGETCPCGAATLKKIGKVTRRRESIVRLSGGAEIYPSLFDELLFTIPEIIDYQLSLGKKDGKDALSFTIEVIERGERVQQRILRLLAEYPVIRENVTQGGMAPPDVELVNRGALLSMSRAKKMILDERLKGGR